MTLCGSNSNNFFSENTFHTFHMKTMGSFIFFSFWFLKIFVCRERRKKTKRPNGCNTALWDLTNNHALFDFFQNWGIVNISKWIHVYYLYTRNAWQTAGNVIKLQEILKLSIWCLKTLLYYTWVIFRYSKSKEDTGSLGLLHVKAAILKVIRIAFD